MSEFDFRTMLGGKEHSLPEAEHLLAVTSAGRVLVNALNMTCALYSAPPHLVIGLVMSEIVAAHNAVGGREHVDQVLKSWRSLLDHLEKPGGLDRG